MALLSREIDLYKSQLGLPVKESDEFGRLTPELQRKAGKFFFTSTVEFAKLLATYCASAPVEESARFIPFLGVAIAGTISFVSTLYFLHSCLGEMEKIALEIVDDCGGRLARQVVSFTYI